MHGKIVFRFAQSVAFDTAMPALKYIPSYTLDDYCHWEGDWELWDGIPVAMSPSPFGAHQWAATRLATLINEQLDAQDCDDCFVLMEVDWIVSQTTVVRPDISLVCGEFPHRFIESAPALIIEVLAESTAAKDRGAKRSLYESEGVTHYLLLDTVSQSFEAHSFVDGKFVEMPQDEPIPILLADGCLLELVVPRRKSK